MAFARVDTAAVAGTGAGASETYGFTITSGVNLALFYICVWENVSQNVTIDDLDWNTTEAPTFIDNQRTGTGRAIIHAYYLNNPTSGSHNLTLTFSGDTTNNVAVMFTFSDAESGANVTASKAYESTANTAHALAATSVAGDIVVDVVGLSGDPGGDYYTAAGDNTKIGALVTDGPWPAYSYANATGSSTDMDWDWTGGNDRASISVAVAVASGGPAAPTGLQIASGTEVSDTEVSFTWTDNASDETGYYIQRDTTDEFTPGAGKRISGDLGANAESYTATGQTADTQFYYLVECYNGGGSSYSNYLGVKTAPARPTAVTPGTREADRIQITLTIPAGSADDEARILWRVKGVEDGWPDMMQLDSTENDETQWVDGLVPGECYEFTGQCGDDAAGLWSRLATIAEEDTAVKARVYAFELETPSTSPRKARVYAYELEVLATNKARVYAYELEIQEVIHTRFDGVDSYDRMTVVDLGV